MTKPANNSSDRSSGLSGSILKRIGRKLILWLGSFFESQSLVGNAPILDNKLFPFLDQFTEQWEDILKEANGILEFREEIPAFQEISPDQKRISKEHNWRTFFLFGFGSKFPKSCAYAPVTASLLENVPDLQSAWFSILAPGYHIPAHKGVSRGILRVHLGLIVPKDREKCRLRVKDVIKTWGPGEIFVFDDTYDHEVWNDTNEERVVLLFDFDRPMKWWGRIVNRSFVSIMKRTSFFKVPKNNLEAFEKRLG
ncbi:MAG: aspartyl/asparaginyl beta-hydroxylase domain-containing protein, partial [Saprospiraceae bacterium]|nr:aspartyl/asparaginyl beta-hydroxylase domain-containing protein [Saprospiraceae bacterium]